MPETNYSFSLLYYALPVIALAITSLAQLLITTNYSKYKKIDAKSKKTGKEVARQILDKHGLKNVSVEEVPGIQPIKWFVYQVIFIPAELLLQSLSLLMNVDMLFKIK